MPSTGDVTVTLPASEAAYLRTFLEGIIDQIKSTTTAKEIETPEVQAAFGSLNRLIRQLPKESEL